MKITEHRDNTLSIRYATQTEVIALAANMVQERMERGELLTSPAASTQLLKLKLSKLEREVFAVLFLDTRHRVIEYQELFQGTIDGAGVYPREVVKAALSCNASAVIFAHNHPSGNAEPSQADQRLTGRLVDALRTVDIRALDHIIVAGAETVSFAERGLI